MSPRDHDFNPGELRKIEAIERTQLEKTSDKFLELLRKYHPEHDPERQPLDAATGC